MRFLDEMAAHLENEGVAQAGKTVFTNSLPSEVILGIGLFGKLTGDPIDHEVPGLRKTSFQLVVRCQNFDEGYELIQQAMDALTITKERSLPEFHINYVRPKHDPVSYPVSDGNLIELSVNFDACYVIV